jgi:hypothetical protein
MTIPRLKQASSKAEMLNDQKKGNKQAKIIVKSA